MLPEVEILLNSCVERIVILSDIAPEKIKVMEDKSNRAVKFHRLESSMEEAVSTFHSLVEAEQRNGGPQKISPWQKTKICQHLKEVTGYGSSHQKTERR